MGSFAFFLPCANFVFQHFLQHIYRTATYMFEKELKRNWSDIIADFFQVVKIRNDFEQMKTILTMFSRPSVSCHNINLHRNKD